MIRKERGPPLAWLIHGQSVPSGQLSPNNLDVRPSRDTRNIFLDLLFPMVPCRSQKHGGINFKWGTI